MAPLVIVTLLVVYSVVIVKAQSPAQFIFGDSLVDPGNNDYILTLARSNFPPNGIDFPGGQATGRFCNGRTAADIVDQLFNISFLPAYLAPTTQGAAILQGVNYASAAGGILDSSGANYIGRISLNQQLAYFQNTKAQFEQLLTPSVAAQVMQKAIYSITIGNNDYINNYLLPVSSTRPQYTPQEFEDLLISELSKQLTLLYNLGARKFVIANVGPLGCIPSQLANNDVQDGVCVEYVNAYVRSFNGATVNLLNTLSAQLPGSVFVIGNSYDFIYERILNPANYGLVNVNTGCCGRGPYNGLIACLPGTTPCAQRDAYLFWDPFHPTDAVNAQLGQGFFSGPTSVISPMNIQQLAAL